ncbi:peptidase inhibitor family I36 protein [Streptomyces sp.]|uniref:peptidase inhibitor family I36 protein n=1 Tax=Streptomyces sp. TaxID=1931 RepID=UPI002D79B079|nr:peptidase inhibitor family I36 protein [Streptomyces sp.]
MRKTLASFAAAGSLALAAVMALPGSAHAAPDCNYGDFCAWTDANFEGQRFNWSGNDHWWEGNIADEDSSWENNGIPGSYSYVGVWASAGESGGMTLCLGPGDEISHNAWANDSGDSHFWYRYFDCTD